MKTIANDKNIDLILQQVFKSEGGYINDVNDPGGETNFGISKRYHPNEDIANLTKERAKEIYINEYILPIYDSIKNYLLNYQYQVIDTAINCGLSRAKQFNKTALGDIEIIKELRTAFYKKIAVNGKEKFLKGWLNRVNIIIYN